MSQDKRIAQREANKVEAVKQINEGIESFQGLIEIINGTNTNAHNVKQILLDGLRATAKFNLLLAELFDKLSTAEKG